MERDGEPEVEQEIQQKKRKKNTSDGEQIRSKKMKLAPGDEGYDPFDFDQHEVEAQGAFPFCVLIYFSRCVSFLCFNLFFKVRFLFVSVCYCCYIFCFGVLLFRFSI